MEQLLLFQENEVEKLQREVSKLKDHCEKLRKSLYARDCELQKQCSEAREELDFLKRYICTGKVA